MSRHTPKQLRTGWTSRSNVEPRALNSKWLAPHVSETGSFRKSRRSRTGEAAVAARSCWTQNDVAARVRGSLGLFPHDTAHVRQGGAQKLHRLLGGQMDQLRERRHRKPRSVVPAREEEAGSVDSVELRRLLREVQGPQLSSIPSRDDLSEICKRCASIDEQGSLALHNDA